MTAPIRSRQIEPFQEDPLSYSRLSTFLQCGKKGHQVYDLGYISGTEASYNVQGKMVHECVETLHQEINVWKQPKSRVIRTAHEILDKQWEAKLCGKRELTFMLNYAGHLEELCKEVKVKQQQKTGRPCQSPKMTNIWKNEYLPKLAGKETIVKDMTRRMNYVEYDPFPDVFTNTYKFMENYCRVITQEFHEPEELYLEYADDPLVTFTGVFEDLGLTHSFARMHDKRYVFPFRGAIDQIWFTKRDDLIFLYDVKTARAPWTVEAVKYHDQLWLYAIHIEREYGRLPDRMGIIDARNAAEISVKPTKALRDRFLKGFNYYLAEFALMKREQFYPPAKSKTLCKFCDFGNDGKCDMFEATTPIYTPNSIPRVS